MVQIVIALIALVIVFGSTKLIRSMDKRVQDRFAPIEKSRRWPARMTMLLLRYPIIGFSC